MIRKGDIWPGNGRKALCIYIRDSRCKLTLGQMYDVIRGDDKSVEIVNDLGIKTWYKISMFDFTKPTPERYYSEEEVIMLLEWATDNYFSRIEDTSKRTMKWQANDEEWITTTQLLEEFNKSKPQ